jgi:23S rRNA (guanine745-N1)-methyltransferase
VSDFYNRKNIALIDYILALRRYCMESKFSETAYKCPVCNERLAKQQKQYVCTNAHSFDISGKGYVNLLLANQKKTKDPGDNKEMMENRRSFLNKGYYLRFSDRLNEVIYSYLEHSPSYVLDAGCGEGYFISKLKNKLTSFNDKTIYFYGIDISKSAINYAIKRDNSINFAVGSNFNLPIMNKSMDCIIRNFAPGDITEFHRVLKESGKLVIVTPGIEHLFELKEILYENARKHEVKDNKFEGFNCIDHQEIKYTILLENSEDIRSLITMTPYYWSISNEMKEKIGQIGSFAATLHFNIDVYSSYNI